MKDWTADLPRQPRIEDQVLEVLSDSSGTIAFNGLRRALQVHPESLTRALRRLERDGAVLRSAGGYALREPLPARSPEPPRARTVAAVRIPPSLSESDLLGRLAGRWLGSLRWLGLYEYPGDPWLVWTVGNTGAHAMLSVRRGTLRVLTDAPPADRKADDAAYALLGRALETLRDGRAVTGEVGIAPLAQVHRTAEPN